MTIAAAPRALARPRLTVDLDALARNYAGYQALSGRAETAVTIKADAYGLGADTVGRALARAGCQTFFVANAEEGVRLRESLGPAPTIYVYNGVLDGEAALFAAHGLAPVLNDVWQIEHWARDAGPSVPAAALHIDTGMSRLGVSAREVEALAGRADLLHAARIALVMSHLACADEPDHPLNPIQARALHDAVARLRPALPKARASLANSAGVCLGPDYAFDLTRPGVGVYGGAPAPSAPALDVVATLEAPILQVRELQPGDTVGYGSTYAARERRVAATVALGYADGFLRAGSGRGYGVLAGVRAPILGRISMDLVTVDVTEAGAAARPGALVEFLGPNVALEDAAAAAQTLNYEMLTGLSARCDRRYVGAGA